jgi:hypothetical protein
MNTEIIPISYMSGTGGNFLCHFIVSAKYNDFSKYALKLSTYGNAHGNGADIPIAPYAPYDSDEKKIDYLLSYNIAKDKIKPYYTLGHIVDLNLITKKFKKSIRITYDNDDIDLLTNIFIGKYVSDSKNLVRTKLSIFIPTTKFQLVKNSTNFVYEQNDNLLCVSWKNVYHDKPQILINKLHKFTDIPAINFSVDQLLEWREATSLGASIVQKRLQEEK